MNSILDSDVVQSETCRVEFFDFENRVPERPRNRRLWARQDVFHFHLRKFSVKRQLVEAFGDFL